MKLEEKLEKLIGKYILPDGTLFTEKMMNDFLLWKSFESDYRIDVIGINKLREILGDPKQFAAQHY